MTRDLVKLTLIWAFLMAVAGGEWLVSGIHMRSENRAVIFLFSFLMVFTIGMGFMRLPKAPTIAIGFAVAGMFWLIVLLGLGSMDALTRNWYPVLNYNPN